MKSRLAICLMSHCREKKQSFSWIFKRTSLQLSLHCQAPEIQSQRWPFPFYTFPSQPPPQYLLYAVVLLFPLPKDLSWHDCTRSPNLNLSEESFSVPQIRGNFPPGINFLSSSLHLEQTTEGKISNHIQKLSSHPFALCTLLRTIPDHSHIINISLGGWNLWR